MAGHAATSTTPGRSGPAPARCSPGRWSAFPRIARSTLGERPARLGGPIVLAGADEHGDVDVFDADLTRPTLLLVGNETTGLTSAWRDLCDLTLRIPITGAASSLNAANAATVVLYEIVRQRLTTPRR